MRIITIQGVPLFKQKIQPCIHGDMGTVAMVVNAFPKVLKAPTGLNMKDLSIPSTALGGLRKKHVLALSRWAQRKY